MAAQKPLLISIEGNIGSGKSTLLKALQAHEAEHGWLHPVSQAPLKVCFMLEPVDQWAKITDANGRTILAHYYDDQKRYAFSFQMLAYISRLATLRKCMRGGYDLVVMERSVFTDSQVFAKMLYDSGLIEEMEYKIYATWFDEFIHDVSPLSFIYLQVDPLIASQRIAQRARSGEEGIPLNYLERCEAYHEQWLCTSHTHDVLLLNGNGDVSDILPELISQIQLFTSALFIKQ